MNSTEADFQTDCMTFTARTALKAAEAMPLSERVMIYRGVVELLPVGSAARLMAESTSAAMEEADRAQLRLFEILDTQP